MKKLFLLSFIFILFQGSVSGQAFDRILRDEKQNGQISESQTVYLEALRAFRPELLPKKYQTDDPPVKCAVRLLSQIREVWSDWNSNQRELFQTYLQRPVLPFSYLSPGARFKIHYDTHGENAVSSQDLDGSGIPDYVEETARTMDHVYAVEVETLNFQPPPDDGHDGPEHDVYIIELSWAYGYTEWDEKLTDNPDTYSSFMVIDNNYDGFPTPGLDGMRVTGAHEFHHMIQMGYHLRDEDGEWGFDDLFIMEATSTWMEDVVYDDINDYVYYLRSFFQQTNIPFDYNLGTRMYGLCIWFHFLEKRLGGRSFGKALWEEIVEFPALVAMNHTLEDMGQSFQEELSLFYGWNYMTKSRADTALYYPEGHTYPETVLDGEYSFIRDTVITKEIKPTAARYYQFDKTDGVTVTIVPVNVDIETDNPSQAFVLEMVLHGGSRPMYTDLDGDSQVKLSPGDEDVWKCVAIVESPGQQTLFISFDTNTLDFDTEDLPSNFPNPFILRDYEQTTIPFILFETGTVTLLIVDASGYKVRKNGQYYIGGTHDGIQFYNWDGKDNSGQEVPTGIYIYILSCNNKIIRKGKIAVVR